MKTFQILLISILFASGAFAQTENMSTETVKSDSTSIEKVDTESKIVESLSNAVDKIIDIRIGELNQDNGASADKIIAISLLLSVVLPLFIIFLAIVLIVYFNNKAKKQRDILKHEVYMKAMETGQTLPEKFFEEAEKPNQNNKSQLSSALVMLFLGVSFLLIGYITGNKGLYFASIVGFIGLGRLIAWIIERPKTDETNRNE